MDGKAVLILSRIECRRARLRQPTHAEKVARELKQNLRLTGGDLQCAMQISDSIHSHTGSHGYVRCEAPQTYVGRRLVK